MSYERAVLAVLFAGLSLSLVACDDDEETSADAAETTDTDGSADTGGSGDADASPDGPVTTELRVILHENPPMNAFMDTFNTEFEAEHPDVTVRMQVVSAGELGPLVHSALRGGDADVVGVFGFANAVQPYMTNVEPPIWQTWIEDDLLLELTDEPFVDRYDAATIEDACSFDGKVYAINLGRVSYSGMFVNEDLLADVGVSVPTTWDELVDVCDAVVAADNACITLGAADFWPVFVGTYGLLGALYPDQAAFVEGLWTGTMKWNDERALVLWNRYQTFVSMVEGGASTLTHDGAPARYATGDVAFMPTGVWQAPALEAAEPDFEWSYIPFPGGDSASDNQYLFGKYDQGWAIAADSPNRDLALEYLSDFSEPDNYQAFIDAVGFIPTQSGTTPSGQIGAELEPYLANYRVGFEQLWVMPAGAGELANGSYGPVYFEPYGVWTDPVALANQVQADLETGLDGE